MRSASWRREAERARKGKTVWGDVGLHERRASPLVRVNGPAKSWWQCSVTATEAQRGGDHDSLTRPCSGPVRGAGGRTGAPRRPRWHHLLLGFDPSVALRHSPDPAGVGLAPVPATGAFVFR